MLFSVRSGEEIHWNMFVVCVYSRVMTYREHGAWVVKAHLQKETDGHIISVRYMLCFSAKIQIQEFNSFSDYTDFNIPNSVNGDVRFFEPRTPDSINVLQTVKGLTALDIHPQANLFAWWVCLCRHRSQSQEKLIKCSQFMIRSCQSTVLGFSIKLVHIHSFSMFTCPWTDI